MTGCQTVDQYHQAFEGEVILRMLAIRKIADEEVPGAEEHGCWIDYTALVGRIDLL